MIYRIKVETERRMNRRDLSRNRNEKKLSGIRRGQDVLKQTFVFCLF